MHKTEDYAVDHGLTPTYFDTPLHKPCIKQKIMQKICSPTEDAIGADNAGWLGIQDVSVSTTPQCL